MAGAAVTVLVVASGASWEPAALTALDEAPGIVVLRRCMDVTDLLAHAAAGDARVAVVAAEAPGLDHDAVTRLRRDGVEPVVVARDGREEVPERARRMGARHLVPAARVLDLPGVVRTAAAASADGATGVGRISGTGQGAPPEPALAGRTAAVWGPAGAPGRTTVAIGIAAELAARGRCPLLVDADPWGGAVAQRLAILDEVSGLLAAARAVARGDDPVAQAPVVRRAAGFRVVTGLPRADRWHEVGDDVVAALVAGAGSDVLLDTGFSIEDDAAADFAGRAGRNGLTHAALDAADVVLAVGTPDPVGLARLARGLDDLADRLAGRPLHVVLNRWRSRLGIEEAEAHRLLSGFADIGGLHVLPDDALAADRSLVTGRTLHEAGPSPLSRAFAPLVDALFPEAGSATAPRHPLRRRRGAAGRRR